MIADVSHQIFGIDFILASDLVADVKHRTTIVQAHSIYTWISSLELV